MDIKTYYSYKELKRQERELRKSLKFHGFGFLTGAAIALEEDKSVSEVLEYGVAGFLATLFLEFAAPKATKFFKKLL